MPVCINCQILESSDQSKEPCLYLILRKQSTNEFQYHKYTFRLYMLLGVVFYLAEEEICSEAESMSQKSFLWVIFSVLCWVHEDIFGPRILSLFCRFLVGFHLAFLFYVQVRIESWTENIFFCQPLHFPPFSCSFLNMCVLNIVVFSLLEQNNLVMSMVLFEHVAVANNWA